MVLTLDEEAEDERVLDERGELDEDTEVEDLDELEELVVEAVAFADILELLDEDARLLEVEDDTFDEEELLDVVLPATAFQTDSRSLPPQSSSTLPLQVMSQPDSASWTLPVLSELPQ